MHLIGVDLGRQVDRSAISIWQDRLVQRPVTIMPDGVPARYRDLPSQLSRIFDCVHLEQMVKVSYPDVATRVKRLLSNPLISLEYVLVVDSTGVGIAVIDMMREMELAPVGVTFTAGREITISDQGYNVPKRDLVVNMQLLYQTGRIKIAADLKLAPDFRDQLKGYTYENKTESRTTTFGAGTDDLHDDLVTSAAIVLWYAEHIMSPVIELPDGRPPKARYNPAKAGLS